MNTLVQTIQKYIYGLAAAVMLAVMFAPLLFATTVSAEELIERSIDMSTSEPSAADVEYTISFTGISETVVESVIVDFCTTPIIGTTCTLPAGFSALTPSFVSATAGGTWVPSSINSNRTLQLLPGTPVALNSEFSIRIGSIATNPSTEGTFYARVLTYAASTGGVHVATSVGTPLDQGTIALSTAEEIDVTARVNESMTFCVSATDPGAGCASPTSPDLTLGEGAEGAQALDNDVVSEAVAYFQISTNSAITTAIKLRNGALSGGLNSGASNAIEAVNDSEPVTIGSGDALFGVRVPISTLGDTVGGAAVIGDSAYATDDLDKYNMVTSAVTAAYGDVIASVEGPTSNALVPLTFGAKANNITAAGVYTAAIVLIATGTY